MIRRIADPSPRWRRLGVLTILAASWLVVTSVTQADIAAQIAACSDTGCVIELEPGKRYVETKPWNLRGKRHLSIRGQGSIVHFSFPKDSPPPVAIDASGAFALHFEGWSMALASKSGRPDVGLLLARNEKNQSSGEHHFARWRIQGWYRKAAVASIASEMNVWLHCWLSNSHPGAIVFWTGRDNELGVRSPFGSFGSGSTNTSHDFFATGFGQYGMVYGDNRKGAAIVVADGTHDLHLRGGTMSLRGQKVQGTIGGQCAIRLGSRGAKPVRNILLDAVEWETVGARNGVLIVGKMYGLTIRDSLLESTEAALRVERGAELIDAIMEGNRLIAGLATYEKTRDSGVISIYGTMERCRLDLSALKLIHRRLPKMLFTAKYSTVRHNDLRLREREDVTDFEAVRRYNQVDTLPE